jgi:putative Ca2+/H+ antiporter (TMEM165/GDT1 family)
MTHLLLLLLLQDRSAVFAGTFGALAIMTLISVALGQVGLLFNSVHAVS